MQLEKKKRKNRTIKINIKLEKSLNSGTLIALEQSRKLSLKVSESTITAILGIFIV